MSLVTFTDSEGRAWRVWNVERVGPSQGRTDFLEPEYRDGWLAFERIGTDERRRLGTFPIDWHELPPERLELLCRSAKPVMRLSGPNRASSHDSTAIADQANRADAAES